MKKINLATTTLSVQCENLTPFYEIANAVNRLGKGIQVSTKTNNDPANVKIHHTYKNPIAYIAGNLFVINENKKRGFSGQHIYMSLIDGYEINADNIKLRDRISDTTLCFEKCAIA